MALVKAPIEGIITSDVETRFTASGAAITSFSIVTKDRVKNRDTNEFEDGPPTFYKVTTWNKLAERCTEILAKGTPVIIIGKIQNRQFEGNDGQKRYSLEVNADAVAINLLFDSVKVNMNGVNRTFTQAGENYGNGPQNGGYGGGGQQPGNQQSAPPQGGHAPQQGGYGQQQGGYGQSAYGGPPPQQGGYNGFTAQQPPQQQAPQQQAPQQDPWPQQPPAPNGL